MTLRKQAVRIGPSRLACSIAPTQAAFSPRGQFKKPSPMDFESRPFESRTPSIRNALDLFDPAAWTTSLLLDGAGRIDLSNDSRILEVERLAGGFQGKRILEYGTLEGAHTYMMASRGGRVTSIEADKAAYLRAIVAKQVLNYNAELLLGDGTKFDGGKYDLVVCCGVLYHLMEPVAFLRRVREMAPRLYFWTHVYAPTVHEHPVAARHFTREAVELDGVTHHPYDYSTALDRPDFSGGFEPGARWITKESLLNELDGFNITIFDEAPDHVHGPAISVYAERK